MKHSVGFVCSSIVLGGALALAHSRSEGHGRQSQLARQHAAEPVRSRRLDTPPTIEGRPEATTASPPAMSGKREVQDTPRSAPPGPLAADLVQSFDLESKRRRVEADLTGQESRPREHLLAMYGRASAASGQFEAAATAYAMFLDEFGTAHAYSSQIAMRLAVCLAPLDLDSVDIIHTDHGPQYRPQWRMGHEVDANGLRQAVAAYKLAADIATNKAGIGRALFRTGWVYRALGDWPASTKAWDRCVAQAAGTKSAADALWLAAENLAWTGDPEAAAERLRWMAANYPADTRVTTIADRIEDFDAEASRSTGWLADPVVSLQAEIEARSAVRSPGEVYRSVMRWLQEREERAAIIAVSRWACRQDDWPTKDRMGCRRDLIDALLRRPDDDARCEAAERLGELVNLAGADAAAVPAAIRRYRLLNELERYAEADQGLDAIGTWVKGSRRWEPIVLTERIESLLKRGERDRAKEALDTLVESYPDYDVEERFGAVFPTTNKEGSR